MCDDLLFSHAFNCSPESQNGCDRLGRPGTEMLVACLDNKPTYTLEYFTFISLLRTYQVHVSICYTALYAFVFFSYPSLIPFVPFQTMKLNDHAR